MYLKYGSYQHDTNEAAVTISKRAQHDPTTGLLTSIRHEWTIEGVLHAASQAALTTAIQALEAAYATDGNTLALYLDDGTVTAHILDPSGTLGGVKIESGPEYPNGRGAEYSTYRSYRIVAVAEVAAAQGGGGGSAGTIITFSETVSLWGGGPRFVYVETLDGPPQKQTVVQQTSVRGSQVGRAVGWSGWPNPPAPIWPDAEHRDLRQVTRESPRLTSDNSTTLKYTEYAISWSYQFEAADDSLVGNPNLPKTRI